MAPLLLPRGRISMFTGYVLQTLGLAGLSQLLPKFQIPLTTSISSNSEMSVVNSAGKKEVQASSYALRCPMDFKPKDVPQDGIYGIDR